MDFFSGRKAAPQQPPQQRYPQSQQYPPQPQQAPYGRVAPENGSAYGKAAFNQTQPPPQRYRDYDPPQEKGGYARTSSQASQGLPPTMLEAYDLESKQMQYGNTAGVSPFDFPKDTFNPKGFFLSLNDCVVTAKQDPVIPQGKVGLSRFQRDWLSVGLYKGRLEVQSYDVTKGGRGHELLGHLDCEIVFVGKKTTTEEFEQDDLQAAFVHLFEDQILAPGEKILMDFKSYPMLVVVMAVQLVDPRMRKDHTTSSDRFARGILTKQSQMAFSQGPVNPVKLAPSKTRPATNAILTPDFKFENMGIGGLDEEFSAIFRRAFASRIFPPGLIQAMGIQHVKGILLYGPPGTGKTLIARRIGKMLKAREPKVINGPEVLNKFVGQSEENVRKLFADAEKEYKEKKDESGLHIIIFDELDAVCKQRGSGAGGGTGVGDSVVNQLLSKLDGVDQLNNILLIGMTNRMDMIDDALLRPGRLEVHMEISLPDEKGRVQILNIHTAKMQSSGNLDKDVNIKDLAARTKNFSGAEISGLVRSATSFALQRHVKVGTEAGVADDVQNLTVNMADFDHAFEDVKPAFGASEDAMESCLQGGFLELGPSFKSITNAGELIIKQVKDEESNARFRALLWGPPGCGKTAIAAYLAKGSDFPYIKLITPDDMIGFSESMKKDHMRRIFDDAYKSPLSLVIIDNIESIIEWVRIGPRFSNPVLQAMKAMLNKQPPKGHRLLVLATATERNVLQDLGLYQAFDSKVAVPNINSDDELIQILEHSQVFQDPNAVLEKLRTVISSREPIGVGVKSVLLAIDTAKQDVDHVQRFVDTVVQIRAESEFV